MFLIILYIGTVCVDECTAQSTVSLKSYFSEAENTVSFLRTEELQIEIVRLRLENDNLKNTLKRTLQRLSNAFGKNAVQREMHSTALSDFIKMYFYYTRRNTFRRMVWETNWTVWKTKKSKEIC